MKMNSIGRPQRCLNIFFFLTFCIIKISCVHAQQCRDTPDETKFWVRQEGGSMVLKSCYHARKNPWGQCEKPEMRQNCKKTCKLCDGDIMCRLKADVQFPQDEDFSESHSESLQIRKVGQDQVCFSENTKTDWGCTHVGGDAFIDGTGDTFEKQSASARVFSADNARFKIEVSRRFIEKDVHQGFDDGAGRANLIIKINGQMQSQSFRHNKNALKETHVGFDQVNEGNSNIGFINPKYNGDYYVDVECDNNCNCNIVRKDQECRLKAQLKFPKILDTTYYGYRSDVVVVTNNEGDQCSKDTPVTSWCQSYGDAITVKFEDPSYYDFNMASFINIPDAAGKRFRFDISHVEGDEDELGLFPEPARLDIYVNGEATTSVSPGPNTPSTSLNVRCDASCDCTYSDGIWEV